MSTFIGPYFIPVIEKYLPDKYIQHWMLFVISLNILLQDKIRIQPDLEIAEYLIKKFVEEFEQLFGERELSYNIHQMIHLGLSRLDDGVPYLEAALSSLKIL